MTRADTRLPAVRPRLFARCEPLGPDEHLLDHLGLDGAAWLDGARDFVTAGIAARVDPADAVATLRAIEHETGRAVLPAGVIGPRAVGALPFDGGGHMTIPARLVERAADGRLWRTDIEPATVPPTRRLPAPRTGGRYAITQLTGTDAWDENVAAILAAIDAGEVDKVVLARAIEIEASEPFDIAAIVAVLHETQPGCIVYADGGFVGASPELLVRRAGHDVTARPLAGTAPHADDLRGSGKDAREHQLVVDAVVDALATSCDHVHALGTAPISLTDLAHLATTITGRVRDLDISAADLALTLHPTPAVAGTPRATALATITRLEATPRDLYAGPCGWVDASGDGEFVVALRGAQIDGNRARLHAGAGIVAGSQPESEWAETQSKLEPMLRALVRP